MSWFCSQNNLASGGDPKYFAFFFLKVVFAVVLYFTIHVTGYRIKFISALFNQDWVAASDHRVCILGSSAGLRIAALDGVVVQIIMNWADRDAPTATF